ncbi:hypothetical protein MBOT_01190 [Mycobacterium botniense]|uniref:Uncharacterized protein n=1 Tax=Mycobacterium botniense TaxID=84962 RepID=A0A7I9XS32_9MYCO|nr:hypothetical protein MBOT_01190 [Mycobacterium botniense]
MAAFQASVTYSARFGNRHMSPSRTSAPLRAFNWLSTTRTGLSCATVGVLSLAGLDGYEYWQTGKAIYGFFVVFMLGLIINAWLQVYRHRNDPSWPPKLQWVSRNRVDEHDQRV